MQLEERLKNRDLKMAQFVDKIIREYFWENGPRFIQGFDDLEDKEQEHIIDMGKTLLLTRDGVFMFPGHFIDAVLKNDLLEAFSRADETNVKAIHWYLLIKLNIAKLNT